MTVYRSIFSKIIAAAFIIFLTFLSSAHQAKAVDAANCVDHPLFTRMNKMNIEKCRTSEFDKFDFKTGSKTVESVEGKLFEIRYKIEAGNTSPSAIAIIRNHQQAFAKIGGKMLFEDSRYTTLKISKDGKEVWAQVDTAWGGGYMLTIVEKETMVQEVVASAELFKSGLKESGHVEVPGIYFDTGKSELKPESDATLKEIARMLQESPELKVWVVGHTDYVGTADSNLSLSAARAASVVKYLTVTLGIDAKRLGSFGAGPYAPIAPNSAEEGRAKNRRVELVVQP